MFDPEMFEEYYTSEGGPQSNGLITFDNVVPTIDLKRFRDKYNQVRTEYSIGQYVQNLKRQGMRRLGKGHYAEAWAAPDSDVVTKVMVMEAVRADDGYFLDPYLRFLHHASKYPSNPFFPKVRSVEVKLYQNYNPYAVIKMERLAKYHRSKASREVKSIFKCMQQVTRLTGSNTHDMSRVVIKALNAGMDQKHFDQVMKVMDRVLDNDLPYYFDLHEGNVMMRGDQMVITDPYVLEL